MNYVPGISLVYYLHFIYLANKKFKTHIVELSDPLVNFIRLSYQQDLWVPFRGCLWLRYRHPLRRKKFKALT